MQIVQNVVMANEFRIAARCVSEEQRDAFREAARLCGIKNLSDWMLMELQKAAEPILRKNQRRVPWLDLPSQLEVEHAGNPPAGKPSKPKKG